MGIAFLYFCLTLVMRSRVQLAIGVIQEAGKALGHMKALLLTPIIQVFGLCLFLVPWIIYVFYLASSGTVNTHVGTTTINGIEQTYTYRTFEYTTNTKYAFLYMIFCYYWTSEFITACGQMLIALTGVEPHIFYCQEGIESPPTMFMAAQQQRGTQFVFATLNCSQILPSGKSIFSKFGLKKLSRQPTVFGVAPWSKHQQVPKAGLVDTKSLVSFLDNAFAPKPRPVSSDKELNSFCGFAKDIASTKHSVTSTCIVLQRGQQHNDYHTQLEEKLVKSYPRSKVAVIDANSKRFSFEGPQSKPAEDISLEIFAVRNGTHFLQMNNKALTWDYVNTFVAQAIATPLYGFDEEPYGAVRLIKSKKTMFKDRSQPKPPPGQQDQQESSSRTSKKPKPDRSSGSAERAASGGSGKDDTGDRIRAERRAAREAKEREQQNQEPHHQNDEPEEDEVDTFDEDDDEDIIEL
jgi:hypothetical protein